MIQLISRYLISGMRIAMFCIAALSFLTSCAQVKGPIEQVNGKGYYMHTVAKGQTLYAISKMYKCDINAILSSNPGSDAGINEGQVLKIPVDQSKGENIIITDAGKGSYLIHEVKKKETLFSIAKLYNVDINEIVAMNPGSDTGINKGQELKIPVKVSKPVVQETPSNMVQHTVQAGETLYAIARQYNVPVDAIKSANPNLSETLSLGQIINIPTRANPTSPLEIVSKPIIVNGPNFKDSYSIAMMLPFYSSEKDTTGFSNKEMLQRKVAIDIYRGALMAKDTMEKKGFSGDFYTYDVIDEKSDATAILAKPEMKNIDLVIGPLFRDPLMAVADWSEKNGVHVVCPVQQSNRVLLTSPNMSKAAPALSTQWETLGRYVATHHAKDNVITINTTDVDDLKMLSIFNDAFIKTKGDSTREFKTTNRSASGISKLIVTGNTNVIIVPSNDRLLITTLFKNISGDNIIVYGTENWENMSVVEPEFRNKFHLHYPKAVYLDYNDEDVQYWIAAYRKRYRSEPTEYSVIGYDLTLYYATGLQKFGRDFPNHFAEIQVDNLVGSGFDYIKTGNESGFENRHILVLQTDDYNVTIAK